MYVTVTDDPLYTKGAIVIEGPTSEEAPRLEGAISKDSKNFRPPILGADHKISKKDVAIWQKGPPSPEESDAHSESGRPLAQTWLPDQRYGFATVNATTVKVHENSTVEWRIAIQQDARTPISDRKFEGLERNTVEQVKQDLDLPATFHDSERLRRDIRHRLTSTGKFYAVHVWPDAPFAPNQAIPLNVQVLE